MQRLIIALILIIIAAAAYLFMAGPVENSPGQVSSNANAPAPQQSDAQSADSARDVIKALTEESKDEALDVTKANNFVTGDQLVKMPNMAKESAASEQIATDMSAGDGAKTQAVEAAPQLVVKQPVVNSQPDQLMKMVGDKNIINADSLSPGEQIRLKELLSNPDMAAGTVFYIHAVTPEDAQGLWGILQQGLTKTFREGIQLQGSETKLVAQIPEMADERLENMRSSFLGNFLYNKVNDIYVYNYQQGMLGQDPDLIKPGQQLIIVSYSEEELIEIYRHFTQG